LIELIYILVDNFLNFQIFHEFHVIFCRTWHNKLAHYNIVFFIITLSYENFKLISVTDSIEISFIKSVNIFLKFLQFLINILNILGNYDL
jgi:hypothetical protein